MGLFYRSLTSLLWLLKYLHFIRSVEGTFEGNGEWGCVFFLFVLFVVCERKSNWLRSINVKIVSITGRICFNFGLRLNCRPPIRKDFWKFKNREITWVEKSLASRFNNKTNVSIAWDSMSHAFRQILGSVFHSYFLGINDSRIRNASIPTE